jgi:hypothetical protein
MEVRIVPRIGLDHVPGEAAVGEGDVSDGEPEGVAVGLLVGDVDQLDARAHDGVVEVAQEYLGGRGVEFVVAPEPGIDIETGPMSLMRRERAAVHVADVADHDCVAEVVEDGQC